ncbi:MAG: hypothetical protein MJ033_05430 [Victivallaceae bacterium]|nr:hypothetical protein [Victivallaceae bacterium]
MQKRVGLVLFLIVIGGTLVRWFRYMLCRQLFRDACFYLLFLQKWTTGVSWNALCLGNGEFASHPILPGAFIVPGILIEKFNFPLEPTAVWYNIVVGTLLVPVIFFSIQVLWPQKRIFALACALLVAVHPSLCEYSATVLRDTTYFLCCGCFFLFLFCWIKSLKNRYVVLCGIFTGFAIVTRIEGFEFILFMVTAMCFFLKPFFKRSGIPLSVFLSTMLGTIILICALGNISLWNALNYYVVERILPHFH